MDERDTPKGVPLDAADSDTDIKHTGMVTLQKGGDPPGVLYTSMRIQCTMRNENSVHRFPFDQHKLKIALRLWGANVKGDVDHGRVLLPLNVQMELQHKHPEWDCLKANAVSMYPRGKRQLLTVDINVKRVSIYFFWNFFVVIGLFTSLAFLVFRVDNSVLRFDTRCAITLPLILTSVAYKLMVVDMVPKVPYLTLLDCYIYTAFSVVASIFTLNTLAVCDEDTPGLWNTQNETCGSGTGLDCDCTIADNVELYGWQSLLGFWGLVNFAFGVFFAWDNYQFRVVDRDYIVRSAGSTTAAQTKREEKRQAAKKKQGLELVFKPGMKTLRQRRGRALKIFEGLERRNLDLLCGVKQLKNDGQFDAAAKLEDKILKNIPLKLNLSKTCRQSKERHAQSDDMDHVDLTPLFKRAGLLRELSSLGPLLASANLSPTNLKRIFNNGRGTSAVLSQLEKAGLNETEDQVKLIAALDDHVGINQFVRNIRYLCLQGSASYLWQDVKVHDQPMDRGTFLTACNNRMKELVQTKRVTAKQLKTCANCILGELMLTTRLGAACQWIYAKRSFNSEALEGSQLFTQVWTGYLQRLSYSEWPDGKDHVAIAVDIGSSKIAYGFGTREGEDRDELRASKVRDDVDPAAFINKFTRAVMGMDVTKKAVFLSDQYDEHETDTERLSAAADELILLLTDIINTIPNTNEQTSIYIFCFGTASLRSQRDKAESEQGMRFTEIIAALSEFAHSKLQIKFCSSSARDRLRRIKLRFDVISPETEAACEHRSFIEGVKHSRKTECPAELKACINKEDIAKTDKFKISNLAWGSQSCQGLMGDDTITIPVGLSLVLHFLQNHANTNRPLSARKRASAYSTSGSNTSLSASVSQSSVKGAGYTLTEAVIEQCKRHMIEKINVSCSTML